MSWRHLLIPSPTISLRCRCSAALLQAATFANWNIASSGSAGKTWRIYEGATAPLLSSLLTPLTLVAMLLLGILTVVIVSTTLKDSLQLVSVCWL